MSAILRLDQKGGENGRNKTKKGKIEYHSSGI